MVIVHFSCIDPNGTDQQFSYGGMSLEACFDIITDLVDSGWQFKRLRLLDQDKTVISLPVEAFDGQSVTKPIQSIQRELEHILA